MKTPVEYVCSLLLPSRQEGPSRAIVFIGRGVNPQAAQYLAAGEALKYIISGQQFKHTPTEVVNQTPEDQSKLLTALMYMRLCLEAESRVHGVSLSGTESPKNHKPSLQKLFAQGLHEVLDEARSHNTRLWTTLLHGYADFLALSYLTCSYAARHITRSHLLPKKQSLFRGK